MRQFMTDLRIARRALFRQPGFLLFVVLMLGLAIGANTAIFAVVRAVLWRPLPFASPDRLVRVWESNPAERREHENASPANFLDWQKDNDVFDGLTYWRDTTATFLGASDPVELPAQMVASNFFSVLGAAPMMGRTFLPEDRRAKVAVVSYALWRDRLGSDPNAIGRSVSLNHETYTIVGVMPQSFSMLGRTASIWYPQEFSPGQFRQRRYLETAGRLKPGVTIAQAEASMRAMASRLEQQYPRTNRRWTIALVPLHEQVVGQARRPLLILLAAAGLVLLIACANVAALLLARSSRREREMAIRSAMGAARWQLMRHLFAEGLWLALGAGTLGFLLVRGGLNLFLAAEPGDMPRVREVAVDPPVLAFTVGLSLLTVFVFGIIPAFRGSGQKLETALRESGGSRGGLHVRHRLSLRVLTIGEIALSVVLLVTAGLLLRGFSTLRATNPGFDVENVVVGQITLPKNTYPEDAKVVAYFEQLLARVRALPGVKSAGAVTSLPFSAVGIDFEAPYTIEGGPVVADAQQQPQMAHRVVTPGYFATIGMRVVAGRDFTDQDRPNSGPVVIVNQKLAQQAWPGEDPIGKRLGFFNSKPWTYMVVGVVNDIHHYGLGVEPKPELFVPQQQAPYYASFAVVARTTTPADAMVGTIAREVLAVDPTQPATELTTMERLLAGSLSRERFLTLLLGMMAGLALFLAVAGIYAVLSFGVSERMHEMGVRMALGAEPRTLVRQILQEGASLAAIGLVLGLIGARLAIGVIRALVFAVSTEDALTYAGVIAVLLGAALLAAYLPARRAASTDPVRALRYE